MCFQDWSIVDKFPTLLCLDKGEVNWYLPNFCLLPSEKSDRTALIATERTIDLTKSRNEKDLDASVGDGTERMACGHNRSLKWGGENMSDFVHPSERHAEAGTLGYTVVVDHRIMMVESILNGPVNVIVVCFSVANEVDDNLGWARRLGRTAESEVSNALLKEMSGKPRDIQSGECVIMPQLGRYRTREKVTRKCTLTMPRVERCAAFRIEDSWCARTILTLGGKKGSKSVFSICSNSHGIGR
jgi:hypothetical protein